MRRLILAAALTALAAPAFAQGWPPPNVPRSSSTPLFQYQPLPDNSTMVQVPQQTNRTLTCVSIPTHDGTGTTITMCN